MKKNYFLLLCSLLLGVTIHAQVSYTGNGNSNFGGTVGGSSLNISDDGTTLTFAFTRGGSTLDNIVVIYIDSKTGGFSDTSTLQDAQDGGRRATSSYTGTQGTLVTFPAGFTADYAVVFANNFAVGFELVAGGNNSHNVVGSAAIDPSGNNAATTHNVTIDWTALGITATDNFKFVATYISDSAFMSDEVIGDSSVSGNQGFNGTLTFTGNRTYPNTWTGAADGNFNDGGNWSNGTVDTNDNLFIPSGLGTYPTLSATTTAPSIVVKSGASLTVASNLGLTVTGDFNNAGTTTVNSGGSLIVGGTSTGNITYNVNVNDTNWHLMSSPVEGEGYDTTWVDANLIDNTTRTTGTNIGIATYINTSDANGDWVYAEDNDTGNFDSGKGYSIKRDATGSDVAFTGTVKEDAATIPITANGIGGASENRWTLIGNPYSAYIDIPSFLALNASPLEDNREAVYVWNGSAYVALTTGYIHPGQGFFVNSNTASENISITKAAVSHQTGVTFYKNSEMTVTLNVSNGNTTKSTEVNYLENKTTGLDPRFDIGTFNGQSTSFDIFTKLVANNNENNFMKQSLPNSDFENMVVPVGITADAGAAITFTAEALNLPTGIKVFLEDRENNTVTRLDEANSNYKVTLNTALNSTGRFYLHTRSSALSSENVALTGVGIYTTNKNTLRINGINSDRASIKIYNILGKKVLDNSFASKGVSDIELPNLNTGIYVVQLSTEKGKISKKIVLE